MESSRAIALVAVLVAVVGLGLAAPTLYDLDTGDGDGEPDGSDLEEGNGADVNYTDQELEEVGDDSGIIEYLRLLLIPLLIGLLYYFLKHEPRRFLAIGGTILLGAFAIVLVLDLIPMWGLPGIPDAPVGPVGEGGGGDGGDGTTVPGGPSLTLLVLVLASLVGLLLFYRYAANPTTDEDERLEAEQAVHAIDATDALGRAAGRAANQIEHTSLENAVYEAWHEMTSAIDVSNPETRTPAEFATAAARAGMASDDVETLTALFQDVRYGPAPVTEERVQQARETLRRIERTYSHEGAEGENAVSASGGNFTVREPSPADESVSEGARTATHEQGREDESE